MDTMYLVPPGSNKVHVVCGPDCVVMTILPHGPIKTAIQHSMSRGQVDALVTGMQQERRALTSGDADVDSFERLSPEARAAFFRGMCHRALVLLNDVQSNAGLAHDGELAKLVADGITDLRDALT